MPKRKNKAVLVQTRVAPDVAEALDSLRAAGVPRYRLLCDILTNTVRGLPPTCNFSTALLRELGEVAEATGFRNVGELVQSLAQAFLRVYKSNRQQLMDDDVPPAEEIREMFADLDVAPAAEYYEDGMSLRKGTK